MSVIAKTCHRTTVVTLITATLTPTVLTPKALFTALAIRDTLGTALIVLVGDKLIFLLFLYNLWVKT